MKLNLFFALFLISTQIFAQNVAQNKDSIDLTTEANKDARNLQASDLRAWTLIDGKNLEIHQLNKSGSTAIITFYHKKEGLKYLKFFLCKNLNNFLDITEKTNCSYLDANAESFISTESLFKNAELKNCDTALWEGFFFLVGSMLPVVRVTRVSQWVASLANASRFLVRTGNFIDGVATLSLQVIQGAGTESLTNKAGMTDKAIVHEEKYSPNIPIRQIKSYDSFITEFRSLINSRNSLLITKEKSNCSDCYQFKAYTPYTELRSYNFYGEMVPIFRN